jgi:hypothetical protein
VDEAHLLETRAGGVERERERERQRQRQREELGVDAYDASSYASSYASFQNLAQEQEHGGHRSTACDRSSGKACLSSFNLKMYYIRHSTLDIACVHLFVVTRTVCR